MKNLYTAAFLFVFISAGAQMNSAMGFTENNGQYQTQPGDSRTILFKSMNSDPQIFITTEGLTYVFAGNVKKGDDNVRSSGEYSSIDMKLDGATITKENVVVENEIPGISNYYYPFCPNGILNVHSYQKVTIKNIYPGIDWVIGANEKDGMYHDFIVHAGADASRIKTIFFGVDQINVTDDGKLEYFSRFGKVTEGKLNTYIEATGEHIPSAYQLSGNRMIYSLPKKAKKANVVIDPPLAWSSSQASSDMDYGYATTAAKDGTGDVLVTGTTLGTNFPTMNAYQGLLYGFQDMVVFRLNAAGTRLWSTYYGGLGDEDGKGISSDNTGNAFVVGSTGSSDMPVLNNTQSAFGGGTWDVAVMEFNSSGVRQWATWYGGLQNDLGTGIATDAGGNSYFTGYTNSSTFPVLFAPQSSKGVGYDAFISKFNSSGTPQWSTFYGGDDDDKGRAICLDASASNVYVTGSTLSGVLATTAGVFQSSNASAYNAEDVFIIKMSSAHVPIFATYSGGSDADFGQGIATDNNGNVFVTGYTLSSDMPLLDAGNGAYFDGTIGSAGTHDAFLLECNSTGTARIWSTYFGGMSVDMGLGIAYDPFIGLYVCGNTASTDFPVQQPSDLNYYQSTQGDGGNYNDMFIAWFGTNDSLRWNTYYGGSTSDEAYGVAVDANHNIFVAGLDSNDIRVLKFGPGMPTGILCTDIYILDDFMYPDPATDQLNFNFLQKNDGEVSFDFISMTGQLVKHEERSFVSCSCNTPSRYNFDVSELAKGTYFLRVTSSERTSTRKFVKQ